MIYRILLIITIILFSAPCLAGEKRYRVEILVLSHIQHEAIPAEAEWLRDFSASLDFLTPEDDEEAEEEAEDDEATLDEDSGTELLAANEPAVDHPGADGPGETEAAPGPETDDELLPDEDQPQDPWANVVVVEELSDVMREAWRHLRLSAPFRPEQYLSWEQSADQPFPLLRMHDLEVVLTDDPFADLRETDAVEPEEQAEEAQNPAQVQETDPLQTEQATGEPAEEAEEPELPDPTLFYRLDGTVMLRRSRFLHLDLDLELRQAVFDDQALARTPILSSESESSASELPVPSSFLIHTLNQSRQVKSRRMEYFDSPVLGVLLWITPFELEDEAESVPD